MFATVRVLSLLAGAAGLSSPERRSLAHRPRVEAWTNRGEDPYTSGQAVRVHFRTAGDAYVTILRVDSDGRVRVLFPREPWQHTFTRGGRDYEVGGGDDHAAFSIDDDPGVGYVFAVAAADPFVYSLIESGDHWDYRMFVDGRVRGDPYVALTALARRIVPDGYGDWDYDLVPYYVERHYDYPRFLCYDCHTYLSYPSRSPYDYSCTRFRIVEYDDPYYYPYRAYGRAPVVFTRPLKPAPRFIFRDRLGSDAFITRVRERPVTGDRRGEHRGDLGIGRRDPGPSGVAAPPRSRPPHERPAPGDAVERDNRSGAGVHRRERPDGAGRGVPSQGERRVPAPGRPMPPRTRREPPPALRARPGPPGAAPARRGPSRNVPRDKHRPEPEPKRPKP